MKTVDLLNMLTEHAKRYRVGASDSLIRNEHMHDVHPHVVALIPPAVIDAVLTDFINSVAYSQCIDYALNAKDLRKEAQPCR